MGSYGQRGFRYQGKKFPKEYSSCVFRRQYVCSKPWYVCTRPYDTKDPTRPQYVSSFILFSLPIHKEASHLKD